MQRAPEGKGKQRASLTSGWRTFKKLKILGGMIWENDELVLDHLKDVKIKILRGPGTNEHHSRISFWVRGILCNKVLTTTYQMQSDRDDSDPFFSKEPEIISSTGCESTGKMVKTSPWKPWGCRNVGALKVSHQPLGNCPAILSSPTSPPGVRVLDVATDYKLGYFFRGSVPTSVLYFTKEAVIISMKSLMRRSRSWRWGRRTAMKNQKKDLKRTWTQQKDSPREPRYLCAALSITQPPFLAYIFKFSPQSK